MVLHGHVVARSHLHKREFPQALRYARSMTHGRRAVKSACRRGASSPWVNRTVFAPPRLITLAPLDIAGDFVTQGTLSITITISILVALALFPLSLRHWRVKSEFTWEDA